MPILGGKFPRSRTIWLFALVVGAGSTTLSLAGLGLGTQYAGPAIASVLLNTAPFFAVLFARISLNERIKLLRGIGLVVGFAGVVIIVLSNPTETGSGGQFIFGVVAVMIGAVGYAIASVVVRYMNVKEIVADLWGFTFAQFLCGTILLIPFALLSGDPGSTQWDAPGFWLTMGFLGIGPQLIAYACFFVALARWPRDGVEFLAARRRRCHRDHARQHSWRRHVAWHGRCDRRCCHREPPQGGEHRRPPRGDHRPRRGIRRGAPRVSTEHIA